MTEESKKKEELDKAARTINAILRLMHKGAMTHDQACTELNAIALNTENLKISYCVGEALKAVETNKTKLRKKEEMASN